MQKSSTGAGIAAPKSPYFTCMCMLLYLHDNEHLEGPSDDKKSIVEWFTKDI